MANNLKGGRFNIAFAKQTINISDTPVTSSTILIILLMDDVVQSYNPLLEINQLEQFEEGKGYLIKPIADMDMTDYFQTTPGDSGNGLLAEDGNELIPES